jgi:short-subunit dehydrogenase involved in D-alanine esterification of teichoic acids
MPAYSASKAALTAFIHCLREQLRGSSVKITEILPPAVQSKFLGHSAAEKELY